MGLRSLTMEEYAESMLGVSHTHMNLVLRGKRSSPRLDGAFYFLLLWAFGPKVADLYPPTPPRGTRK